MVKVIARAVVMLALLSVPAQALAQLAVAGVVRDTSGGILPGVNVEASSPSLIEKVRTAVTDGSGQYQVVNLVPGTYTVTFTLAGFSTVKREGIELSGQAFVAAVNAEMRVGAVAETVTVQGAAPTVDVQNVIEQQTLSHQLVGEIPAAQQFFTEAQLIPGVVLTNMPGGIDVGGTAGVPQAALLDHGSKTLDFRLDVDGLSVGTGGAGFTMWMPDPTQSQEVSFTTSGGLGEAQTPGPIVNLVPKSGGNRFTGTVLFNGTNSSFQGSNSDAALQALGFTNPSRVKEIYDFNPGAGGPIVRDNLWVYGAYRNNLVENTVANTYTNLNAGNPNAWTYVPNLGAPAFQSDRYKTGSVRLTWQATPRNKFAAYWNEQSRCESCAGAQAGGAGASGVGVTAYRSPEATQVGTSWPDRVQQLTWSSPVSNRLLLQAGIGTQFEREDTKARTDGTACSPACIPVTEQAGALPGILYRGPDQYRDHWGAQIEWKASLNYVTGTHNAKFGFFGQYVGPSTSDDNYAPGSNLAYRFNNGVPISLTEYAAPVHISDTLQVGGLYAQDSITLKRLTLQGGVRYDSESTSWSAETEGPFLYMPTALSFPAGNGVNWHDITPRMSVAYDLRGDGKTALKFALGKYMTVPISCTGSCGGYAQNPVARLAFNTTRSWNDAGISPSSPAYYIPQCDLTNPSANGNCGAMANRNFGLGAPFSTNYDSNVYSGWGNRPYQWEMSVGVQQQLAARVSLDAGFYRRWFGNFAVTDNLAFNVSDYTPFTITLPSNPSLPGGGGQTITAYDYNPAKFGQTLNQVKLDSNFGGITEHWDGVDINVNIRPRNGLTLQAGIDAGDSSYNVCNVAAQVPGILSALTLFDAQGNAGAAGGWTPTQYCNMSTGVRTQFKGLASYRIPRIDVLVSGTFQSIPGIPLAADYNVPNAVAAPALGRNLAGGAAFTAVHIAQPGTLFGATINQLDMRFGKNLTLYGTKLLAAVDLYNLLNTNTIENYNQTYGSAFLNPTRIMPPRFLKFSVQLDW
jgi:hypothetical protein